jgi:hypothetical protein
MGQNYTNGAANAFNYTYNRLNRLTIAAAGNNLGEAISYDVMANITSLNPHQRKSFCLGRCERMTCT